MDLYNLPKNKTFLTSVKAVIVHANKVLLLHSTEQHKHWELPGGLLNIEETFYDCLTREIKEETTLTGIKPIEFIWVSDDWRTRFPFKDNSMRDVRVIEIIFRCEGPLGKIKLSDEHSEYIWATKEEVKKLSMFPFHRRAIIERIF